MKKFLILTAVALLAFSTGCRCNRWLWRGPAHETSVMTCPPEYTQGPVITDPCGAPPMVMPGPADYAPVLE